MFLPLVLRMLVCPTQAGIAACRTRTLEGAFGEMFTNTMRANAFPCFLYCKTHVQQRWSKRTTEAPSRGIASQVAWR
ncbi:hypothetical protein BC826DRAFT_1074774 [Russula brevipes]|nr:hypothetical protein BC826DRAFT_1074774 [Russula brevipes]